MIPRLLSRYAAEVAVHRPGLNGLFLWQTWFPKPEKRLRWGFFPSGRLLFPYRIWVPIGRAREAPPIAALAGRLCLLQGRYKEIEVDWVDVAYRDNAQIRCGRGVKSKS
jgi:hypothetical protein